jgi:hypothetical protein
LSEQRYEPTWIIRNQDDGTTKWAALAFDKARYDRCAQLLKPEIPGGSEWMLFTGDPTGRKKLRNTSGSLCDPDALWLFEHGTERGKTIVTKYTAAGDLAYRISFDQPAPIHGFSGHIMRPTFKAENGYLSFEWWDTDQPGLDRHIKRSMKVRIVEPRTPAS